MESKGSSCASDGLCLYKPGTISEENAPDCKVIHRNSALLGLHLQNGFVKKPKKFQKKNEHISQKVMSIMGP